MANYCDCNLKITSQDTHFIHEMFSTINPQTKPKSFMENLKSLFKREKKKTILGLLTFLQPMPDDLQDVSIQRAWRLENWGCQHDAQIESCAILTPHTLQIKFATPWSPPLLALKTSALERNFHYKLSYFELGNALIGEADESQNIEYSFSFDKAPAKEGIPSHLIKEFNLHEIYLEYLQNPS